MDKDVLREVQLTELEMLKEIKRICIKHDIRYFLSSGTLLGAVRHKGFIPWDDDIDIEMPYRDYIKFTKIAKKELSDKYFLQNCFTDTNFQRSFTKIRKNNTTYLENNLVGYDIHHGIWIDIFPLVEVTPGFDFQKKKLFIKLCNYCQAENLVRIRSDEFKRNMSKVGFFALKVFFKVPKKIRIYLHKLLLGYVCNGKGEFFSLLWIELSRLYPKRLYLNSYTELMFEDDYFSVPPGWDELLSIIYGDYMTPPPEDKRFNHSPSIIDFKVGTCK